MSAPVPMTPLRAGCVVLALVWPGSAVAQAVKVDPATIARCLATQSDAPMVCVGQAARACFDDYGGGPDMVMAACLESELAYWDDLLNLAYASVMDRARQEQNIDLGYAPDQLTDRMRGMQRAWIEFRDATCALDVARAMPFGSAAGPAHGGCMVRETARQVFQLRYIEGTFVP